MESGELRPNQRRSRRSSSQYEDLTQNYYELLNVKRDASKIEIREAYLRLKNSLQSNQNAFYSLEGDVSVDDYVTDLEKAFSTLENDQLRKAYDQRLARTLGAEVAKPQVPLAKNESLNLDDPFADFMTTKVTETSTQVKIPETQRVEPPQADSRAHSVHLPSCTEIEEKSLEILSDEQQFGTGNALTNLRELHGKTIDDIFKTIRIGPDLLEALEKENTAALPNIVYVKGFLANYLRHLNIKSCKAFVDRYVERLELS